MDLNLIYDPSTASAPSGFSTVLTAAANYLDALIINPITVNISVGWGELNGTPITNESESLGGSAPSTVLTYTQVVNALFNNASSNTASAASVTAFESLPNNDPSNGQGFLVSDALQKAWGLLPANGTAIDGYVGFGTQPTYNFSTNGTGSGLSLLGVALHELTHALGRFSDLGNPGGYLSTLDLYRYSAPGVLQTDQNTPFAPAYFSINGGTTDLAAFDTTSDNADWASSVPDDAFDATSTYGQPDPMSAVDITEMNVLGFSIASNAGLACFAAGTRIRTPRGDVPVEALRAGRDSVITASSAVAPIRWIGTRSVIPARFARPAEVLPVRILRGALAPGRPARDLYLSPDHAVLLDGVLIPVRYLVNGRSIAPVAVAQVRYCHVELDRHDVILAEGQPAETYLDTGNRAAFARSGHRRAASVAAARGIWARRGCAPLLLAGPRLIAVRRRLLHRAGRLGHALTDDPALTLHADAVPLRPQVQRQCWQVELPHGTRQLHFASSTRIPAHVAADETDTRCLGVALRQIWIDGREAALDSPALHAGWHDPEPGWRWTGGEAAIEVNGARHVAFTVANIGRYWAGPA